MTSILGIFVCVKFHEKLPMPYIITFASSAISCFVFNWCTYTPLGNVYKCSMEYLRVGDLNLSKEWRLTKRSMKRLAVHVRNNYIMQRQTLLTVFSLIINYTASLLVSF